MLRGIVRDWRRGYSKTNSMAFAHFYVRRLFISKKSINSQNKGCKYFSVDYNE